MGNKNLIFTLLLIVLLGLLMGSQSAANNTFTQEEQHWLEDNRHRTFNLGLEPDSGKSYFIYQGNRVGYLMPMVDLMKQELGLNINIIGDKHWTEVYEGLQKGTVDILFGANVTEERLKFMTFTQAVEKCPYAIFINTSSDYHTLGDFKDKKIGYLSDDYVITALKARYPNISFNAMPYPSNKDLFIELNLNKVDAVVTEGSEILYNYRSLYPNTRLLLILNNITSDMTLSVRKEDQLLAGILDKFIRKNLDGQIKQYQNDAERLFNHKILNLTPEEIAWLDKNQAVHVGISNNYLPYEYYGDGKFKGIAGAWINKISSLTGIRFESVKVTGPFEDLIAKAKRGEVDVLDLAKTESRLEYFIFGTPYETARDIILGRLDSKPINTIHDLEGKTVAVIRGYWHKEYLYTNLSDNVKTIDTKDITESMTLVRDGKADYLIDNPFVIQYYLEGLGYNDLTKRGETTAESYLYFGVGKQNPELASIMNKAIQIINPDEMKAEGLQTAPRVQDLRSGRLFEVVLVLAVSIVGILMYVSYLIRQLIRRKVEVQLHIEREALLLTDALTGLGNRAAFANFQELIDLHPFPQAVVVSDLNNLKRVNDNYGHMAGDELLVKYADSLKHHGAKGMIFRMGGDEFLMLMPSCDEEAVKVLVSEIETTLVQGCVLMPDGLMIVPMAAVGHAIRYSPQDKLCDAISIADTHMYELKRKMKSDQVDEERRT